MIDFDQMVRAALKPRGLAQGEDNTAQADRAAVVAVVREAFMRGAFEERSDRVEHLEALAKHHDDEATRAYEPHEHRQIACVLREAAAAIRALPPRASSIDDYDHRAGDVWERGDIRRMVLDVSGLRIVLTLDDCTLGTYQHTPEYLASLGWVRTKRAAR